MDKEPRECPSAAVIFVRMSRAGRRAGLSVNAADDCAMDACVKLLLSGGRVHPACPDGPVCATRVGHFAHDQVRGYVGTLVRERERVVSFEDIRDQYGAPFKPYFPSNDPTPEQIAILRAFWDAVEPLLAQLSGRQRTILLARLAGDSSHEIAESLGMTPNAVSLVLQRVRARLVMGAERTALDAAELRSYLSSTPGRPLHPPLMRMIEAPCEKKSRFCGITRHVFPIGCPYISRGARKLFRPVPPDAQVAACREIVRTLELIGQT